MSKSEKEGQKKHQPESDSKDYSHTFYGILNAQGQFWTPMPFESESDARQRLDRTMLLTHKIVPVRIQLTALPTPETDDE